MKDKKVKNKLEQIDYEKNKELEVLDCTKELEEVIKELLPKE
jgi:hypothetical protein